LLKSVIKFVCKECAIREGQKRVDDSHRRHEKQCTDQGSAKIGCRCRSRSKEKRAALVKEANNVS